LHPAKERLPTAGPDKRRMRQRVKSSPDSVVGEAASWPACYQSL
jgi:hypothetical protein